MQAEQALQRSVSPRHESSTASSRNLVRRFCTSAPLSDVAGWGRPRSPNDVRALVVQMRALVKTSRVWTCIWPTCAAPTELVAHLCSRRHLGAMPIS